VTQTPASLPLRTEAEYGTYARTSFPGSEARLQARRARRLRRARSGVARVASRAFRRVRATVTPAGWLLLATVGLAAFVGVPLGWMELAAAGVFAAALLLLSTTFLVGADAHEVDLELSDSRVVAGTEVRGHIVVRNTGRRLTLPGRIDIPVGAGLVDFHVPLLRAGQEYRESVIVPAYRRGVIDVGPVTTVKGDPLRILKREVRWPDVRTLYVHPVTTPIPSTSAGMLRDLEGNPSKIVVSSDISFHAIREYARGDSQRQIHWKSTAKTGTLMVRQYDESRRSRITAVLSLAASDYATEEEFEMAVSAAGSLGVRAIRDGRDVGLTVGAEVGESHSPESLISSLNVVSARTLLDDLAKVSASDAMTSLEEVCAITSATIASTSIAFVVCGSHVGLKRLQSAAMRFPLDVSTVAVVCNQEAPPAVKHFSNLTVMSIAVLEDLRQLMARGATA